MPLKKEKKEKKKKRKEKSRAEKKNNEDKKLKIIIECSVARRSARLQGCTL